MKSYHFLTENRILLEERRIEKLWEGVGYKLKEAAPAPATPAPAKAPAAAPGFDYKSIAGMTPSPGAVTPKAAPNYSNAGPATYGKTTMTVKEELIREYEAFLMEQYENTRNHSTRGR